MDRPTQPSFRRMAPGSGSYCIRVKLPGGGTVEYTSVLAHKIPDLISRLKDLVSQLERIHYPEQESPWRD